MNKKVGVVICNYNKQDYVLACIKSVLESSFTEMDVYVVDNASTDDSVKLIREKYADQVTLIVNEENLGGSGGFNSGLRKALQESYQYLMCVDNDIVMEKDNIEKLYLFLEENPQVGIVGSKICRMQHPERLQELGANLDFENCTHAPLYKDYLDNAELPEVQYCDYVPACSLMIRREVVEKIGIMPEENFIYWDDMEWCYKAKMAGYQVAAYSQARVFHDMGTNAGMTYFSTYYFWRNKIKFFCKYTPEAKRETMTNALLESLFMTMYGCYYKEKKNQISIMMHAFDDAVHGNLGKAAEGVILPKDEVEDRLVKLLASHDSILIAYNGNVKLLQKILNCYKQCNPEADVTICANEDLFEEAKLQAADINVVSVEENVDATLQLVMCEHVSKITDDSLSKVYLDPYSNLLETEQDVQHFSNVEYNKKIFMEMWKVLLADIKTVSE